jgi:hypothetical protein
MALPEDQLPEDENDFFDYAGDILAAPFRGVEGAVQGAYNLADYLAFDVLPDYDTRFLGTSKTMAGGLVEGVAQFATGFVPIFGAAGRAGMFAKAGKAAGAVRAVTAGAITDFTFFNGQEARLSNLIQQYPELQNPVTEFLAHDAEEGEIEGRLKNVLEGLGLEAVAGVFISGLKGIKKVRDVRNNGGTPEEAAAAVDEVLQGGRVFVDDEAQIAARRTLEEDTATTQELGVWTGLSETEELFKTPVIDSTDFTTLSQTIAPKAGRVVPKTIPGARPESARSFDIIDTESVDPEITPPLKANQGEYGLEKGTPFYRTTVASHDQEFLRTTLNQVKDLITLDLGNKELVEVGALKTGRTGQGGKIYQVALQYAHNTDKVYIPKNLSFINVARTLGSMFSSALKNKTTKHFAPVGGEQADQMAAMGLPKGYKWGQDFQKDLDYLAIGERNLVKDRLSKTFKYGSQQVEKEGIKTRIPEEARETVLNLDDYKYSFEDDVFTGPRADGSVGELSTEDINNLIKSVDPDFTLGIGASTFKRAVVTDSIEKMPFIVGDEAAGKIAQRIGELEGVRGIFPAPTRAGDLDVRFTGPKKAGIAQEFKEKTLIEGVGQRMQTDNPVTAREALQELVDKTGGRLGQYQPVIDRLLALGKGTGIDAKLETRAAASDLPTTKKGSFYESGKRRIVLDGDSSSFQQNPVYELLHESTHAVTVDNVNKYFDANAFNAIDINDIGARAAAIDEVLKQRLPKPIAEMFRMFKKADSMRDEIIAKGDLKTVAGEADTYWIKNPAEFMSMAFSDPVVQRALKGIEYDPNMSLWEKIVDTVKRLLGKGVTNDLADSIVTRVGEIAQMRLPRRRGRGTVDFAPSFDPKKPNEFLQAVPEKFRGYAEALLEGGTPRLPQFALETGDDVIVLKELLESYYKENPDKITVEGAVTEIGEEVEKQLMLQKGKDAATKVAEARIVQQSLRDQGSAVIQNLQDSIKKYEVAGGGDKAIAEIKNSFQQLLSIGDVYRQLGREGGILLGSRRENFRSRKIGISESDYEIDGIRKEFVNASGSDPDKMVKIISETIDPNDPQATFEKLFKISKKAQGKSMLDMPTEYWMNAILSGPKTQVVNAMGNSLTQIWSSIEAVFGGIASGNMDVVRAVMAAWSDKEMYKEAGKFAKKAFKQSDNVLDPNARSFSDRPEVAITGKRISEALPGQGLSTKQEAGLDWFANNVIRIPSRLLMTTDEFFKQLAYRRAARLKAAMSGIQQGINNPKQLAAHINNTLEGVITEGGRMGSKEGLAREANEIAVQKGITDTTEKNNFILDYVEQNFDGDKSALIQYAQDEARYLTFTKELEEGIGASFQRFTNNHPFFRFILPFVRTPTNILTFALERTPLVATPLMKQEFAILKKEFMSEDPIVKAQARGKVVTAVLVVGGLVEAISDSESSITGGGPKNEKEKKALQEAGWQPYSIKIGDTYYSYQRLDPLATPLGIVADLVQTGRDISALESKDNEKLLEHAYQSMIISLTRNITNKSYLTGIQNFIDALSDPERFAAKFSRNFASSFVPNILSQMADSDEQVLRETRGVMDAVKRKIGLRGSLDAKRNILGEEIMTETLLASPFQAVNPIAISTKKDDPILQAMAELKHGFRNPISNLGGDIDLLDYENESGQSAYDRWLELVSQVKVRGDTLRQRLNRLIKSRDFKNTSPLSEPGLESPRIQMITSVLREFRNEARKQMLKEFPDLDRQYSTLALARTRLKTGVSREDVLELLTQ